MTTSELLLLYASTVVTVNAEDATSNIWGTKICAAASIFSVRFWIQRLDYIFCNLYLVADYTSCNPTLHMSPTPLSSGWQWTRSAPLYLGASDTTASGVFRAKDHEMLLLSAESERQKDKRVSGGEGKGETETKGAGGWTKRPKRRGKKNSFKSHDKEIKRGSERAQPRVHV